MTEGELAQVRAPEALTFTVLRASNLKGQRGDTVNAIVKVEFGDKSLGESPKVECTPENPAEFNYNSTINVTFEDPITIDELSCRAILCTVIEVLPKEKKQQKEEKTAVLGQCTIDLLPMLQGELKYRSTLTIHPVPGSPIENLLPEQAKPELDVLLSVNEPILTDAQLKDSNLLCVTVESLYSPPESWGLSTQYMYTAALPMPLSNEKENTVVFAGGQLKPGVDKETPNKQKKWAIPSNAQGNAVYIADRFLSSDAIDDEDGDFKTKEDREHRTTAEQDKNRVTWNIERRCYLDNTANSSLQDKIAKTRYWPVEISRTSLPSGAKGKGKEEDGLSFHGVAYINLAPLLYPGVKRIHGAYKVVGFNEHELQEKTLRRGGVADEAVKIANGILSRSSSSPFPKPTGKKEESKGKDPKKGNTTIGAGTFNDSKPSQMKTSDSASEADGPVINVEGQQYVEAKSYVIIEISLQRPLVPKRPPEELAKRVAEYIPPRPMFPKRTDGAERAVADFQNQVGVVANLILDEFRDLFGDALQSGELGGNQQAVDERRQQLMYHLNGSGKYFAFKEQLKHSIVKIVREKYLKTTSFTDRDELQTFLSELYVYVVDQMHVGLDKVLAVEDQTPIPSPLTDSAQLKHFAREAEVNENFDLAAKYYQERIARDKNEPDNWLDYGTFCLYINDLTKAEECFKECVSIDQRHEQGLLLNGVVCTMQDKHEVAETFFEAATCFYPKSIQAWTMLGLFYDGIGNEIGTEMALIEANKLNMAAAVASAKPESEVDTGRTPSHSSEPVKDDLLDADKPTDALSKEGSTVGGEGAVAMHAKQPTTPTSLTGSEAGKARSVKAERRNSAQARSKSGKLKGTDNPSRPASRNKSPLAPGATDDTQDDTVPPREPTPVPTSSIFMQVVHFLLEVKAMPFTERALAHHLLDELGGPNAEYYICLAQLRLQKHQLDGAEASLQEALQYDHQNADAWALMGHVKYLVGDTDTARHCYERTLAFISNASEMHSIYLRLASIYLQESKFEEAKSTFLMACKRSPSCVSWLGVGIACYRLGELSEAEDALCEANILNNTDPEVWAYLSMVCLKTGRQLEAEQAYKYALKLNFQDESLLTELNQLQEEVGFGNPNF